MRPPTTDPTPNATNATTRCTDGEARGPGDGKAEKDHVARHVGHEDVAQEEIAERIDQPGDDRHGDQERRQGTERRVPAGNEGLADLAEKCGHVQGSPLGIVGDERRHRPRIGLAYRPCSKKALSVIGCSSPGPGGNRTEPAGNDRERAGCKTLGFSAMNYWVTYPMTTHSYNPELVNKAALIEFCQVAEAAGFAGIGFTDHPLPRNGG